MLVPAPYKEPEKKAKGAKSGPCRKGASDAMSEDEEAHSSVPGDDDEEKEEEEEEDNSPSEERRKKRAAPTNLEAGTPKRGKGALAANTAWDVDSSPEPHPRSKPRAASPARASIQRSSSGGSLDPKEMASIAIGLDLAYC
nr:uncharacterized protein LOC109748265 [Aegilops tauschii subsp. strangulata]